MSQQRKLRKLKCTSELTVRFVDTPPEQLRVKDMQRGQLFLREGCVCMRVEIGSCFPQREDHEDGYWIINLQTGRVWQSDNREVERVTAELLVSV